ncbi:sigma 54-interacting transcriptional regulator [Fusibacter paucivorans]|uniref:Sigma 54-interacting transcriptional regulator n=2 Tax=Fusibacter paucivorans TaxID=76009 RepID=A0ABS5PMU8_9FIRM|nr:sigma 54-interacting transcriptional regulator [Fusibacter paucivorans]MBS7526508.1 sigma 54-interacting transcriptional regulator [Fusibacter paucivorans]
MEIIDEFIEKAYEGLIIVDKDGFIIKFKYEKFLDVKEEEVMGKHVTEVIENTRLHIVLKTGHPEIGDVQTIKGHNVITSRIPILRDGVVVGAVGTILFKDVSEVKHMVEHLDQMKVHIKKYKQDLPRLNQAKYSFEQILTNDPQMLMMIGIAKRAAETNSSVYIEGRSGTGKEYFSHAIHEASYRRYGPFVKINCAGIPKDLFESELFGYEPGAFTGASSHGKIGKFELANGGTIFLDELSSMPYEMQAKLLRVIEERELERIGGNERIPLDIRFISASNENLREMVENGRFRSDLYYRLNVVTISLPPLAERKRDVSMLAGHFLKLFAVDYPNCPTQFSREALHCLEQYQWPGNIRELRNVIESAVSLTNAKTIIASSLPDYISKFRQNLHQNSEFNPLSLPLEGDLKHMMQDVERQIILDALDKCHGNRTEAAVMLGIHRTALYKKMNKLGIDDDV